MESGPYPLLAGPWGSEIPGPVRLFFLIELIMRVKELVLFRSFFHLGGLSSLRLTSPACPGFIVLSFTIAPTAACLRYIASTIPAAGPWESQRLQAAVFSIATVLR